MNKTIKLTKKDLAELAKVTKILHELNMRMFGIIGKEIPFP